MSRAIHQFYKSSGLTASVEALLSTWGYWAPDEFRSALDSGNYTFFYTLDQGQAVGALLVFLSDDFADVMYLYTDPAYRRQNIGMNLLLQCETVLKAGGLVKKIFLEVRKDNIAAQKLYEAFGMKVLSQRSKYYSDGCDALVYCKEI